MKCAIRLVCALLLLVPAAIVVSQDVFFEGNTWSAPEGNWQVRNGRLEQIDTTRGRAKANLAVSQSGDVEYRFDARYLGGADDGYAAFGVHVLVRNPNRTVAWGNGISYLLWLTYDPNTYGGSGVWAQVYKSSNGSNMSRHSFSNIDYHVELPAAYLRGITLDNVGNFTLPVRIRVDARTGRVRVKDPVDPDLWWAFALGETNLSGTHVTLRTSSLAASFDNVRVLRLR